MLGCPCKEAYHNKAGEIAYTISKFFSSGVSNQYLDNSIIGRSFYHMYRLSEVGGAFDRYCRLFAVRVPSLVFFFYLLQEV